MDNKTQLEKEIVDILINMIPVSWSKISFLAQREKGYGTFFYGYIEAETNMMITSDIYPERYDNYPYSKREIPVMFLRNTKKIFKQDHAEMGDNVWREFVCTIENNGEFKFEYLYPNGKDYEYMSRADFLMKYLNSEYIAVCGKYPSKEFVPAEKNHLL